MHAGQGRPQAAARLSVPVQICDSRAVKSRVHHDTVAPLVCVKAQQAVAAAETTARRTVG